VAEGWRKPVLAAARRLNMEPALRRAQLSFGDATERRDLQDRAQLRLLMRLSLPIDANCIDIGANVGEVLEEIVEIAPRGHHVAYEPLPELAADLARRYAQVDIRNAAVSDTAGERTFFRVTSASTRSSLSAVGLDPSDFEPIQVRVEVLDDSLPSDYAPALIKIDVEGNEAAVLRGAGRLLTEHRPIVVFEHGAAAAAFPNTTREIHALLISAGFRIFDIDANGPFTAGELEAVVQRGRIWTFVAHP
jgi:FkbM family methyltransferase